MCMYLAQNAGLHRYSTGLLFESHCFLNAIYSYLSCAPLPPACSPVFADISEEEALVLHVTLSPRDAGTLTMYAPVLIDETM